MMLMTPLNTVAMLVMASLILGAVGLGVGAIVWAVMWVWSR
jgi:hypothetical protein